MFQTNGNVAAAVEKLLISALAKGDSKATNHAPKQPSLQEAEDGAGGAAASSPIASFFFRSPVPRAKIENPNSAHAPSLSSSSSSQLQQQNRPKRPQTKGPGTLARKNSGAANHVTPRTTMFQKPNSYVDSKPTSHSPEATNAPLQDDHVVIDGEDSPAPCSHVSTSSSIMSASTFNEPAKRRKLANVSGPLAERMRPKDLGGVFGHAKILNLVREMVENGHLQSMILWGPPGCGKSTLARITGKAKGYAFVTLSAVAAGIPEVLATKISAHAPLP
jgi:hypothetical protein